MTLRGEHADHTVAAVAHPHLLPGGRLRAEQLAQMVRLYKTLGVALDGPGIVSDIANFFASQGINIEAMECNTYLAAHTGSVMFAMSMTVNLPARVHIATMRENFMLFCDDRNLDAIIEPFKA